MNPEVPIPTPVRLKEFCEAQHIVKLAVYGSALREDFGPDSDIDVLVKFDTDAGVSPFHQFKVQEDLAPLFGGRRIDLFTAESLPSYTRDRIIAEAEHLFPCRKLGKQPPRAVDEDTPLRFMRDLARRAIEKTAGRTRQDLGEDRLLRYLVCYAIQRIGLPVKRVSEAQRKKFPGIDFEELADLRRHLIEQRHAIDLDRLWAAVTEICPAIVTALDAFLPPEDERPGAYRGEPLDW